MIIFKNSFKKLLIIKIIFNILTQLLLANSVHFSDKLKIVKFNSIAKSTEEYHQQIQRNDENYVNLLSSLLFNNREKRKTKFDWQQDEDDESANDDDDYNDENLRYQIKYSNTASDNLKNNSRNSNGSITGNNKKIVFITTKNPFNNNNQGGKLKSLNNNVTDVIHETDFIKILNKETEPLKPHKSDIKSILWGIDDEHDNNIDNLVATNISKIRSNVQGESKIIKSVIHLKSTERNQSHLNMKSLTTIGKDQEVVQKQVEIIEKPSKIMKNNQDKQEKQIIKEIRAAKIINECNDEEDTNSDQPATIKKSIKLSNHDIVIDDLLLNSKLHSIIDSSISTTKKIDQKDQHRAQITKLLTLIPQPSLQTEMSSSSSHTNLLTDDLKPTTFRNFIAMINLQNKKYKNIDNRKIVKNYQQGDGDKIIETEEVLQTDDDDRSSDKVDVMTRMIDDIKKISLNLRFGNTKLTNNEDIKMTAPNQTVIKDIIRKQLHNMEYVDSYI